MKVNTSDGTAMAIWVMEFQVLGYKIRKIFVKKLLNFENWCNGEVSNIGYNFRK